MNYDPFGQPEAGTGLGSPADYGFTGEPQGDGPAAGGALVQLRARWYAPGQGAFVSRDPFAGLADAPQSYSPYAYAHNDPTNRTDPTGRTPLREPGGGGDGAGDDWRAANAAAVVAAVGGLARQFGPGGGGCLDQGGIVHLTGPTGTLPSVIEEAAKVAADAWAAWRPAAPGLGALAVAACVASAPVCVATLVGGGTLIVFVAVAMSYTPPDVAGATDAQGRPVAAPGPAPCPLDAKGLPNCGIGTARQEGDKVCRGQTLYHYTDVASAIAIVSQQRIIATGPAYDPVANFAYPPGAYATDINPLTNITQQELARRMYFSSDRRDIQVRQGKLAYCVALCNDQAPPLRFEYIAPYQYAIRAPKGSLVPVRALYYGANPMRRE